jgi:leucyl aminopeptidase
MPSLLPLQKAPRIRLIAGLPAASALDVHDAVLLLQPTDARSAGKLPNARLWQLLQKRGKVTHGVVRSASFDNRRQTLAVSAFCNADASPFELLRVAGLAVARVFAERPGAMRVAIIVQGAAKSRGSWQESLYAALAAHAFVLPADKSNTSVPTLARVDILNAANFDARRAEVLADANNLVRHLTALPPNVLDARGYRRLLGTLARRHKLQLRWHGEAQLARLGAGAFLAVARGNPRRDAGIAELRHAPHGRAARPDIALVGKGVLFDTGGTNLKPHKSMLDMHTDMAGSAVALATLVAAARLRLPLAMDAFLAITENNIGPKAYRPQEVVRAINGTTIQVIHSDAEGRMALADTLALAARRKPRAMVDFATLTGACVYALTERMSGLLATNDALAAQLLAAGTASGERLWQFPLPEDYDSDLDSPTADIAQCAVKGEGDHILAARFLQRFVPAEIAWAHIDLSSATRRGGLAHVPTEITGFGARLALTFLLDHRKTA